MKRLIIFLIVVSVIAGMIGCFTEELIPDANLEEAIREEMSKYTGDIYPSDVADLTHLDASSRNILDITGLEHCDSLLILILNGNQISDISPLGTLTSLKGLTLDDNQISDTSSLSDLTSLTYLHLAHNQISDVSPLASLTNIASLNLGDNQISDLSTLANLTELSGLWLYENQISDLSPLVDNQGLSEGDEVHVWGNPLSSTSINTYIPQLQARGVVVDY